MKPRLPFGKYAGRTLDQVSGDYLVWMVESDKVSPTWRALARKQLGIDEFCPEANDDTLRVHDPDRRPAADVLPLLVFEWHERMLALHRDYPAALAVIDAGYAVLRDLSARVTGRRHPTEQELAEARTSLAEAEHVEYRP